MQYVYIKSKTIFNSTAIHLCVHGTSRNRIQNYSKVKYSAIVLVLLSPIYLVMYSPNAIAHFPLSFQLDLRVHKSGFYIIFEGKVTPF